MTPLERAHYVRDHLPAEGLFAEKTWRIAPQPFALSPAHVELIEKLGIVLHHFNTACNLLYRQSAAGKAHPWVAPLLDAGKPPELIALSRHDKVKGQVPAVIRPDLILTEDGFALSELDSVPGGIGLTAWLGETYSALGENVLGGADGMRKGFESILNGGEVLISEESAAYRPEMEWLVGADRVRSVEDYTPSGKPAYRFFEAFDYPKLDEIQGGVAAGPAAHRAAQALPRGKTVARAFLVAPAAGILAAGNRREGAEAAPAHHPLLVGARSRAAAAARGHSRAQHPVVGGDGTVQPEAARPRPEDFRLLARLPGARAASTSAPTCPAEEWAEQVRTALAEFSEHPRVLQRFVKGALAKQDYVAENDEIVTLNGRARVCPYYFVVNDRVTLGGVLVTLVPADKKLIHGMRDAIISPAVALKAAQSI